MKTHVNPAAVYFQEKYFLCQWIFMFLLPENEKIHALSFSLVPGHLGDRFSAQM